VVQEGPATQFAMEEQPGSDDERTVESWVQQPPPHIREARLAEGKAAEEVRGCNRAWSGWGRPARGSLSLGRGARRLHAVKVQPGRHPIQDVSICRRTGGLPPPELLQALEPKLAEAGHRN